MDLYIHSSIRRQLYHLHFILLQYLLEYIGSNDNKSFLGSGGAGFESRPTYLLFSLVFVVFFSPIMQMSE
jgi:hypothetical protein